MRKLLLALILAGLLLSFGCTSTKQKMVDRADDFCTGGFNASCNEQACNFTCANGRSVVCQISPQRASNSFDCYGDGKY